MGEMQSNVLKFAELVHYINTPKINLQSWCTFKEWFWWWGMISHFRGKITDGDKEKKVGSQFLSDVAF